MVAAVSLVAMVLVFAATRPEPPPERPPGVFVAVAALDIAPGLRIAADAITEVEIRVEGIGAGRFLGWERALELVAEGAITRRRLSPGDPLLVSDITAVGEGKRVLSFGIPAPSAAAIRAGDVVDFIAAGTPETRRVVAERVPVVALEGGNIIVLVDEDELFAVFDAALEGTLWPVRTGTAPPLGEQPEEGDATAPSTSVTDDTPDGGN